MPNRNRDAAESCGPSYNWVFMTFPPPNVEVLGSEGSCKGGTSPLGSRYWPPIDTTNFV
jgi:hypothetical protein